MKNNRLLSSLIALTLCTAALPFPSVYADAEGVSAADIYSSSDHEKHEKALTDHYLKDSTAKKYYDAITADMSWYTDKTEYFSLLDVTGDGCPELITTRTYNNRPFRRFYDLKNGIPEFMYSLYLSRGDLTPFTDKSGKICWLYSDKYETRSDNGSYLMKSEYGLLYFSEDSVKKSVKFSAYEKTDTESDTLTVKYRSADQIYYSKRLKNYSANETSYTQRVKQYYKEWFTAAGEWEAYCFNGEPTYSLDCVSSSYDCDLCNYGFFGNGSTYSIPMDTKQFPEDDLYGLKSIIESSSYCTSLSCTAIKKAKDSQLLRMNIAELCYIYRNYPGMLSFARYYRRSGSGEIDAAKPVIYLYPEEESRIKVRVGLNGRFTCTYPDYKSGWEVTASPDGTLHTADGYEYSYLYWEGDITGSWDMSEGFVVKAEDTADFLREKLSFLGLTPKEYNEFIVYWLPQLQSSPYNLITFQTEEYEKAVSLDVSPEPESVIRVFMVYSPLNGYTDIPQQELHPSARSGYTLVEWGGARLG